MKAVGPETQLFVDENMAEARVVPFAGASAVVYSARGPDKDGANEDACGVIPTGPDSGVLVVADGLGGQPGGENASIQVLRCLEDALAGAIRDESPSRGAILDAIEQANQKVMDLGIGAATTLAAAEFSGGMLRPYHVGDSSILVVGQRGKLKLQTVAHSPVGYAVEAGFLDAHEAMHHEERHLISNMVGATDMRIEVGSAFELAARDTVLLASDGLLDNLSLAEIVETIRTRPLPAVAHTLAGVAGGRMRSPVDGEPSKPDDLTFVLFRPTPRSKTD